MADETPQPVVPATEAPPDAAPDAATPAPSEVPAEPASTDAPAAETPDAAALAKQNEGLRTANARLQSERDTAQARVAQLESGVLSQDGEWLGFLEDCANRGMNASQIRDAVERQRRERAQGREQTVAQTTARDAIIGKVALEENGRDFALFLKDLTEGEGALAITERNLPRLRAQYDKFTAQGKNPIQAAAAASTEPAAVTAKGKTAPRVPAASGAQGVGPAESKAAANLEAMSRMSSRSLFKMHFAGKK